MTPGDHQKLRNARRGALRCSDDRTRNTDDARGCASYSRAPDLACVRAASCSYALTRMEPDLPAVVLQEFSAGYEDRAVIHSISAAIQRKRTTALLGPGRSGKSTLLQAVAGVQGKNQWTSGGLWRLPCPMSVLAQKPLAASRPLAQLLPRRRGDGGHPAAFIQHFWRQVAPTVASELAARVDRPLGELPPPLRRLAEFTAAASGSAPLLLLDEPATGTDDRGRQWIRDKLVSMRGQRTIVLVTHNLRFAHAVSHDAIFLLDGEVVEAGITEQMFTRPLRTRTRNLIKYGS